MVFISNDVYFDSAAYSEISIGKNVTISKEVSFLVHDYSIHMALVNIDRKPEKGIAHFISGISIGEDSFIGMRVTLLPGTQIGRNCIIGAGAVVKGIIPDNSIVIGNPAKVIGDTREWAERKFLEHNYLE